VLDFDQIIFASPVYWYAVSAPMKVFIDRLSDLLEVPELLDHGRRLRGKKGYVVCTSISEEPDAPFVQAFEETFEYLGTEYGALVHANCEDGYEPSKFEDDVRRFIEQVRCGAAPA